MSDQSVAERAADAAGMAGSAEVVGFPPFDASTFSSQLVWLALTFGTLYWMMSRVVLPRIGGILEDRRDRIAGDRDEAARLSAIAQETRDTYEKALADARLRAQSVMNAKRAETREAIESRRAAVEAEISTKINAAQNRIAASEKEAVSLIGDIVGDVARDAVIRITNKKPTAKQLRDAVAEIGG